LLLGSKPCDLCSCNVQFAVRLQQRRQTESAVPVVDDAVRFAGFVYAAGFAA
jgi:hypothetical protein